VLVGHGSAGSGHSRRDAEIEQVLAAAGADEPVAVQCSDGVLRFVHPKSFHALRWLDALDAEMAVVARQIAVARQTETPQQAVVIASGLLVESMAVRLWAWILTHREPGLPFDDDQASPNPPKWTRTISPEDLLSLCRAHAEANRRRLEIMAKAFPSDPSSPSRLPLSGLLSSFASEHDYPTRQVLRHTTLGAIFAQTVSAAQSAREANERMQRERGDD
jgi:hypothetical protein